MGDKPVKDNKVNFSGTHRGKVYLRPVLIHNRKTYVMPSDA